MTKKTNIDALISAIEAEDKEAFLDIAGLIAEEFFDNQRRVMLALEAIAKHLAPVVEGGDPNQAELPLEEGMTVEAVRKRHL